MTITIPKLQEADRNVVDAFARVRERASSMNYQLGSWLSDVDPLAELAQFERRHEEWRARAAKASDLDTVNRLVASANENARGAGALVGIAEQITMTQAVAVTVEATVETVKQSVAATFSWGKWAVPLLAVCAAVIYGARAFLKFKEKDGE